MMRPRTIRVIRVLAVPVAAVAALALTGAAAAPRAGGPAARPAVTARPPIGYVADSGSADVTPFDTALNRPGPPIPVHGSPGALTVSPDGQYVWVASSAGVTPIGTDFDKAGPLIPITGGAASLAIKPNSFTLWATVNNSSATRTEVVAITTTTKKAGKPFTFSPGPGAGPAPLVFSPYSLTLYVASALGAVTPVNIHTGQAGRAIPFGFKDAHGTAHLALSPDGKMLYAFGSDPGQTVTTVTPISIVTGKAGKPITVGQGPQAIAFSPDGKTAYVVSSGAGPKASVAAKITPVSTVTGKAAPAINLGPTATNVWASIMPGGAKLYASARWAGHHSNTVFSVSTATNTILKEAWPSYPGAIAFTPDGATAFIIDGGPRLGLGVVVSMTTATDTYHPGFWVGGEPVAIALAP
jgi:DNA-binding beta-propeller fold protein YncE